MSIFNSINVTKPKSNTFNLSHDRKMSMVMGTLTPTLCMDVLPGDKISLNSTQMLRFAPLMAPVMHRIDVYQHFFFVPNRLVWDNWEDFITGGEDGTDTSVFPTIQVGPNYENVSNAPGSLADYLGIPSSSRQLDVSAIPSAQFRKQMVKKSLHDIQKAQYDARQSDLEGQYKQFEIKRAKNGQMRGDDYKKVLLDKTLNMWDDLKNYQVPKPWKN